MKSNVPQNDNSLIGVKFQGVCLHYDMQSYENPDTMENTTADYQ